MKNVKLLACDLYCAAVLPWSKSWNSNLQISAASDFSNEAYRKKEKREKMNKKKLWALVLTGVMAAQALGSSAYGAAFTDGTVQDTFSEEDLALTETPDKSDVFKEQESDARNTEEVFSDGGEEDKFTSGPKEDEALAEEVFSENREPVRIGDAEYTYIPETDSYRVTCILGDGKTVVLEPEVNGKKVTEIGESVYYTTDDDEVYAIGGNVVIPDTVVKIADEAFKYGECIYMNIPDSVTEIGTGIFNGCFNLRTLRFTAGVKVFPSGLFRECENLETIEIPQGVEKIADQAMQGCPGLEAVHIPPSVTEIGETLFDEGTSVTIYGASGSYAQTYAREHQIPFQTEGETLPPSETKPKIDGVYYTYREDTDSYAVTGFGADIPQEVILPSTVNGKEVTEIADRAFYYCLYLQSIRIPGTIKHIGDSAFFQCVSLKDVTMEDGISTLGPYVFAYDRSLGSIEIPDSVTQIGEGCFYFGTVQKLKLSAGLKEISDGMLQYLYVPGDIVIPDGVTRIGDAAFECLCCEKVFIPDTVEQIGNMAFAGAVIEKIDIPDSVKTIGDSAFSGLNLTSKTIVIPDSVTKIGKYIFSGCDAASITLGRGIKEIPEGAFLYTKAEALIIPDSVVSIQSKAFEDTDFYRIALPANVRYIKKDAFLNNPYLTLFVKKNSFAEKYAKAMKIPYDNGSIYAAVVTKNGIQYQYNSQNGTYILARTDENLSGAVKIPASINGKKVVAIKEKAFFGRDKVTSVTIPESVTDIGTQAFYGCKAKKINIPKGIKILKEKVFSNSGIESVSIPSSVVTIESGAFEATELVEFSLPGTVKNVGKGILKSCEKLKKIQFPEGIKEIPEEFASWCSNLETISIPGSVKRIGAGAFGGTGIEKIRLPEKLEEIGESTFTDCTNLKSIVLPETLRKLGAGAFAYCESLSEISIPGRVEKIFEETFEKCTSLRKVVFEDGVRYVEADAFRGCEGNIREMHMTDSLMDIENPGKFENCTFYGFSETKIEDACIAFGFPFVSVGTNVLKAPEFKAAVKSGNCIQIHRDGYVRGADFYEYAISKDKNFPKTGNVLYQTEGDEEWSFEALDNRIYYVFARSYQDREWWYQVHYERVYSDWSAPVKVQITQSLKTSRIQKATVKGNTVTVTVASVPGAEGYGIVLSEDRSKDGCQKLLKPVRIRYGSKNNTSTTYTFKNVKPGSYCVLARAYKKLGGGQTVYSKWAGYSKRIKVN